MIGKYLSRGEIKMAYEQFTFWLMGFIANKDSITEEEVTIIKGHMHHWPTKAYNIPSMTKYTLREG